MRSLVSGAPWRAGSSIVEPLAGPWVLTFLRSAYYRRPRPERALADLRLAHGIIATFWARHGRRVGPGDAFAFRRAFGRSRIDPEEQNARNLNNAGLRAGAVTLLGDWFPDAWDDPQRRRYGIAFPSREGAEGFDPALRLNHARLGILDPPRYPPEEQVWDTYPAVRLPRASVALDALADPARWPDFSTAAGRFTPLRRGGVEGQSFEIHLMTTAPGPVMAPTRGYVTCTALHTDPESVGEYFAATPHSIADRLAGAAPVMAIELTTHRGHFMGRGISRILIYRDHGSTYIRDVGSWDPMPPLLEIGYRAGGKQAQKLFWGTDEPESGLFMQLAALR